MDLRELSQLYPSEKSSAVTSEGGDVPPEFRRKREMFVRLVRRQIRNADEQALGYVDEAERCNSCTGKLWRYRYYILMFLLLLLLMYSSLIYGAVIGAGVCRKGEKYKYCHVGNLPGLHYTPNLMSVF